MFRVQLAQNTIAKQITELNGKESMRKRALKKSSDDLEQDRREVIQFVQEQNNKKQQSEDREKQLMKEKQQLDEKIRHNETITAAMKTEIEKENDILLALLAYKDFVLELTPNEDKEVFLRNQTELRA